GWSESETHYASVHGIDRLMPIIRVLDVREKADPGPVRRRQRRRFHLRRQLSRRRRHARAGHDLWIHLRKASGREPQSRPGGELDRLHQYQAAVCFRDAPPGQNGSRHLPFALRKVVISTAESAMKMMTTIRMALPPMPDDCAAGTGALRCCRSS